MSWENKKLFRYAGRMWGFAPLFLYFRFGAKVLRITKSELWTTKKKNRKAFNIIQGYIRYGIKERSAIELLS